MAMAKKTVKRKRATLSPEDKAKRKFESSIDQCFISMGFKLWKSACGKKIKFNQRTSDLDGLYVLDNLFIICEHTTENRVDAHFKNKNIFYQDVMKNQQEFVDWMQGLDNSDQYFGFDNEVIIKIVYVSTFKVSEELINVCDYVHFWGPKELIYFKTLSSAIEKSAVPELLQYLEIEDHEVSTVYKEPSSAADSFEAIGLLDRQSKFGPDIRVATFYIHPEALMERAYVIRTQGWKSGLSYQRMLAKGKLNKLRQHLLKEKTVYVNNIITTILASDFEIISDTPTKFKFRILRKHGIIAIIDGQHRLYSYHISKSSNEDELKMDDLRRRHKLLATSLIIPDSWTAQERGAFEAKLFLDINSKQTSANSFIKQIINRELQPWSDLAISSFIMDKLNETGPLRGLLLINEYDTGNIKTTTIMNYGVKQLISTNKSESIVKWFKINDDHDFKDENSRSKYINFCVEHINKLFYAFVKNVKSGQFEAPTESNGFNVTIIIGLIKYLGFLIRDSSSGFSLDDYDENFKKMPRIDFSRYKSSQYTVLGKYLYDSLNKK